MTYADPEIKRQYQRQWIAKRRSDYFSNKSCTRCGSTKDLELDHVDRHQKVAHKIWSWSQERRETELAKCQVLCTQCHKKKSIEDMAAEGIEMYQHGTDRMYKSGCRCDPCRAYKAKARRRETRWIQSH